MLFGASFATARLMFFIGKGRLVLLPTVIGSALSIGLLWIMPITSNATLYVTVAAAIGGTIAGDYLLRRSAEKAGQMIQKSETAGHLIAKADDMIGKADDAVGDALFRATERFADKAIGKLFASTDKDERIKLIKKRMNSDVIEFTLPAEVKDTHDKVLAKLEDSNFRGQHKNIEIRTGEHLGYYIFICIPRVDVSLKFADYKGALKITLTLSALDYYSLGSMGETLRANKEVDKQAASLIDDIAWVVTKIASEVCPNDVTIKYVQETLNVVRQSTLS